MLMRDGDSASAAIFIRDQLLTNVVLKFGYARNEVGDCQVYQAEYQDAL